MQKRAFTKIERNAQTATSILLVAAFLLSGSLAFAGKKKKETKPEATVDTSNLVWPKPPQPARIKWEKQLMGEIEAKGLANAVPRKKGWMDRLAGVTLPSEEPHYQLQRPWGVAIDSFGRVFVADTGARQVFVFDVEKKTFGLRGNKAPAEIGVPMSVAVDSQDRLYVSDGALHRINCFDADGRLLAVFGEDKLSRPVGLAIDNDRQVLYVADPPAGKIAVFNLENREFVRTIGKQFKGEEPPEGTFNNPTNVAVDPDGMLYVVDTFNDRIQVFDPEGNFLHTFGELGSVGPGKFMRPKGIAIDGDGHVYVTDAQFNVVQIFDRDGKPLLLFGRLGREPGQFTLVSGIAVDANNRVVVADQAPGRIQLFRYFTDREVAKAKSAKAASSNKGSSTSENAQAGATPK